MSQMIPEYGGCLWPVDPACLGDDWDELEVEQQERALALATSALRGLTAYRVGGCPVTVRPCQKGTSCVSDGSWFNPANWAGKWYNSSCQGCETACEIVLPAPVGEVYEIKVDGIALDLDDFRLDNSNILVWQGQGDCPFPFNQNLNLPDTDVGTFSITYLNAYPVDSTGAVAAAYLALEFAKACKPKGKCSLPRGVTNVVRNGISFDVQVGLFPDGTTNIDVVDAFIRQWNPEGRKMATKVWSPGSHVPRRSSSVPTGG